MEIYSPAEDSYLLARNISKCSKGKVLEIGTGSGIVAAEAAANAEKVVAVDINDEALKHAKGAYKKIKNLEFRKSDLFSRIKEKFDLIAFNPPYLPNDRKFYDSALHGGKNGYETIEKFLKKASAHLESNGIILIVISTQTKPVKVGEIIDKYAFKFEKIDEEKMFFETLYVYRIEKKEILKELENRGLSEIKKINRGKRGIIYKGKYQRKDVAIKVEKEDNKNNTIKNEIEKLKILNKKRIGPELIAEDEKYFIYKYIKGDFIEDFLQKNDTKAIRNVLKKIFSQLKTMDDMNLNKEEMHNPFKHIIIDSKNKPHLVDFERCKETGARKINRKNITQFCQYITSKKISDILKKKGIKINKDKIIFLAKEYKEKYGIKEYKNILREIIY